VIRDTLIGRRAVVGLLATIVFAGFVGTAQASTSCPRVTFLTSTVSPGGTLTLRATDRTGRRCSAALTSLDAGSQIKLGSRRLSRGRAVWSHRLPLNAAVGHWQATVSCSLGEEASRTFKVAVPVVAPAQIEVVNSGFVTQPNDFSSSATLICGVELKNVSRTDARNVTVNVSFADTQGTAVATSTTNLSLIPAGQVFYMSCSQETSVSLTVASVQVSVKVGESTSPTGSLPTVSNLVLTPDQYGTQTLTGSLTNTYKTQLSQDAEIYALHYSATGGLVGSESTSTGAAVEPGATVSFSFQYIDPTVTTTEVSVDPCGFDVLIGQCTLP
jgi:hypothetical protein